MEPEDFGTWTPEPSVAAMIRGASGVRAAGPTAFLAGGLLLIWLDTGGGALSALRTGCLLQVVAVIARFRCRVPKRSEPADYDDRALRALAMYMRTPVPSVRVIPRQGASIRVRGTATKPAIVLSPLSLLGWKRDPRSHGVQLAHEMGHVWAGDLGRFYFLSTGVLFVAAFLLSAPWVLAPQLVRILLLGLAASSVSLRSFLRSREHAADFLAAQVLGESARDALPETELHETSLPALLQPHPTPAQRRRAFGDPDILFAGLRVPMFAFGCCTTFALVMVGLAVRRMTGASTTTAFEVAVVAVAVVVLVTCGGMLAFATPLAPGHLLRSWLRWFLSGTGACALLSRQTVPSLRELVVVGVVVFGVAPVIQLLSVLLFLLPGDIEEIGSRRNRLLQGIAPALVWVGLLHVTRYGIAVKVANAIRNLPPFG
ncbi:MAG: Peptidase family [Frankiaceae bacterium]|jgi:hypothetical protein|nr:Peptidase family [Frankiaceae bacterium]